MIFSPAAERLRGVAPQELDNPSPIGQRFAAILVGPT